MPRKLRLEFAGAIYHVTNRGDRREAIFESDQDRHLFLTTLAEACAKTDWQVHAYCLLPDHFHCVIETPQPNLVAGMKWWLGTYTNRFNRRHRQNGHVFAGRYKALPLATEGAFFRLACLHVHLNPARTPALAVGQRLAQYPWSSFPLYLKTPAERPAWLRGDRLLAAEGLMGDTAVNRRELERRVEAARMAEPPADWAGLRRGWYFGGDTFRAGLLARMSVGAGIVEHGTRPTESAQYDGERIVAEELASRGWTPGELAQLRKTAAAKVQIARRLRRETTLSLRWIATRLCMGSVNTLRNALLAAAKPEAETSRPVAGLTPEPSTVDALPRRTDRVEPASASVPFSASAEPGPFSVDWD